MKKRSRLFWLLLFFVVCGIFVTVSKAADKPKPDLSGNWQRDPKKSKMGRLTEKQLENIKVTLQIFHQEPELRISVVTDNNGKLVNGETVFYTDGRGEMNTPKFTQAITLGSLPADPDSISQEKVKSKTKWAGAKIVSSTSSTINVAGNIFHIDSREIRELSEDGKILTITYSMSSPGGTVEFKEVYNRIP